MDDASAVIEKELAYGRRETNLMTQERDCLKRALDAWPDVAETTAGYAGAGNAAEARLRLLEEATAYEASLPQSVYEYFEKHATPEQRRHAAVLEADRQRLHAEIEALNGQLDRRLGTDN